MSYVVPHTLWAGYFIYFEFAPVFFLMDAFDGCSLLQLKK